MTRMILSVSGTSYGVCGTPTNLKDSEGNTLFVGDVAAVFNKELNEMSTMYVVDKDGKAYLYGYVKSYNEDFQSEDLIVTRVKFFDEVVEGEKYQILRCKTATTDEVEDAQITATILCDAIFTKDANGKIVNTDILKLKCIKDVKFID